MIYTSYYGNWRKWRNKTIPISIARSTPRGFKGLVYKKLAPSFELLNDWNNRKITEQEYENRYYAEIADLDKEEVKNELNKMAFGSDIVLLCYEGKNDFCHRHLAAKWLGGVEEL